MFVLPAIYLYLEHSVVKTIILRQSKKRKKKKKTKEMNESKEQFCLSQFHTLDDSILYRDRATTVTTEHKCS